jgi:uncharacterized protein YodC (DUF2158 family)
MQWKKGDVVRLKTGGPRMTVDELHTSIGKVGCVWFDADNQVQRDAFNPESLADGSPAARAPQPSLVR